MAIALIAVFLLIINDYNYCDRFPQESGIKSTIHIRPVDKANCLQQRFAIAFSQEFGRGDVYEGGGELLAAANSDRLGFPQELGALYFPQEFGKGDRLGFPQELGALYFPQEFGKGDRSSQ